jgi:phosphatidylglycerol---prolipoprotein diacylglyceryl transferase
VLPEIHLGPITLQTFGIAFGLAFVSVGLVAARRFRELDLPVDWAYEIVFAALVGGLVGARLDYVAQNWSKVSGDLLGNLFSGSGLVWYGGFAGGVIGVVAWAWWRGWLGVALLDFCSVLLALGYAIGRVGCQVSGDGDYGTASHLPWAMAYPKGTVPTDVRVHPTPVYETLTMGLIALALWRLRDRFAAGTLFALYLVLAGMERLLVEFIRRNSDVVIGLTLPQLISIAMIVAGGGGLAARGLRPREVAATA